MTLDLRFIEPETRTAHPLAVLLTTSRQLPINSRPREDARKFLFSPTKILLVIHVTFTFHDSALFYYN